MHVCMHACIYVCIYGWVGAWIDRCVYGWMEIISIVISIIHKSLSSSIVPQCFKHALVKPLFKKSLDLNCLKYYRPLSNLPFLSNVLEHNVSVPKQCSPPLESHSLLESIQCHSTKTTLLHVVTDPLWPSDSGWLSIL